MAADVKLQDGENIIPARGKIIVIQDDAEETLGSSNLVVIESAREKPNSGSVVAVGPGEYLENTFYTEAVPTTSPLPAYVYKPVELPVDYKPGDRVIFGKYSGFEQAIGGVVFLVLEDSDIIGKFVKNNA